MSSGYTEEQLQEYHQQYQQQLSMAMAMPAPPSSSSLAPPPASDSGNRNLIVNYIPQSFSESDLLELFKPYGQIESCKIVMDKVTAQSLGYGFVKFVNEEDAASAITGLTGTQIMNKTLKVSVAKPAATTIANLYVSGLDPTMDEETLKTIFSPYGNVMETKILIGRRSEWFELLPSNCLV
jgi:RNA recognition motif-containing protein